MFHYIYRNPKTPFDESQAFHCIVLQANNYQIRTKKNTKNYTKFDQNNVLLFYLLHKLVNYLFTIHKSDYYYYYLCTVIFNGDWRIDTTNPLIQNIRRTSFTLYEYKRNKF
jgi:hypothetical protein